MMAFCVSYSFVTLNAHVSEQSEESVKWVSLVLISYILLVLFL